MAGALLAALVTPLLQPTASSWTDSVSVTASGDTGFWLPWYGQLRLDGTTLCLDIPSRNDAAGQDLQLYACNSTPAQIWFFDSDHRVRVFVQGQYSSYDGARIRCLQYHGNGQPVTIQNCRTGYAPQQWTLAQVNGVYQLSSVDTPTQCVDVPSTSQTQGTRVVTSSCTALNRARGWQPEFVATISYA